MKMVLYSTCDKTLNLLSIQVLRSLHDPTKNDGENEVSFSSFLVSSTHQEINGMNAI